MSETKHTPGPWVAIRSNERFQPGSHPPIFEDGLWHILPEANPERLPIASVDHADDHHPPSRERAEHEARLIAAAPDLLDACRLALATFNDAAMTAGLLGHQTMAQALLIAATHTATVIAKAEGR